MSFAPPQSLATSRQDKLLGMFVAIALALVLFVYIQGAVLEQKQWVKYTAQMSSSYGMSSGAPVRLNGVNVGSIERLELALSGRVIITLRLEKQYQELYTQGSHLVVDTTLALDNVLSGAGLELVSGSDGPLAPGSTIPVKEPKSLDSLIEEWNIEALAQQVSEILTNLDEVMKTVRDNQQNLTTSLDNIASMSSTLAEASQSLPDVLNKLDKTLNTMQLTVGDSKVLLEQNIGVFNDTLNTSSEMMLTITQLAESVKPVAQGLPETQALLNSVLAETHEVSIKLNEHWLLGSEDEAMAVSSEREATFTLPPDDSLYKENTKPKDAKGDIKP